MSAKPVVFYLATEVVPYAKTGGLADVAGALPIALRQRGVDISVVMPHYPRFTPPEKFGLENTGLSVEVWLGGQKHTGYVLRGDNRGVPVYFIGHTGFFDREQLYGTPEGDYPDNAERFAFFSYAALELAKKLGLRPDVFHLNDWQTSFLPIRLADKPDPYFQNSRKILTIHNLAYQGLFPPEVLPCIGLSYHIFHMEATEYYGKFNTLKGGIVFSDFITTVSPTYAREIQTPEYGHGLDGILRKLGNKIVGILNGLDYEVWNPATDPALFARYTARNVRRGKTLNRKGLLESLKMPDLGLPLAGMVSRLAEQKGIDLVAAALEQAPDLGFQFVILGTGDKKYHDLLGEIARQHPDRVSVTLAFDATLARRIYAASDFFLMPSRFEPCGLGQMIALRYGTLPIVRATGGLKDTVVDVAHPEGYGFVFEPYEAPAFLDTLRRARAFYDQKKALLQAVRRGMKLDFSWDRSARQYEELYRRALKP